MTFHESAKAKFDRGAAEHKENWIEDVDPVKELLEELLDIHNYATHIKLQGEIATELQEFAKKYWERLAGQRITL